MTINAETEKSLINEWQNEPSEARRNEIFAVFENIAYIVAQDYRRYRNQDFFEDLKSECLGALLVCLDYFNTEAGYRFSTYAYRVLHQKIKDYIVKNSNLWGVNVTSRSIRGKFYQVMRLVTSDPSMKAIEQFSKEFGIPLDDLMSYYHATSTVQLDHPISGLDVDPYQILASARENHEDSIDLDRIKALTYAIAPARGRAIRIRYFGEDDGGMSSAASWQLAHEGIQDIKRILGVKE